MAINIHGYKKYKCTGIDIFVNDLNIVPYPFSKKFPLIKVYKKILEYFVYFKI